MRYSQLAVPLSTETPKTQSSPLSAMAIYLPTPWWGDLPAQGHLYAFHLDQACFAVPGYHPATCLHLILLTTRHLRRKERFPEAVLEDPSLFGS